MAGKNFSPGLFSFREARGDNSSDGLQKLRQFIKEVLPMKRLIYILLIKAVCLMIGYSDGLFAHSNSASSMDCFTCHRAMAGKEAVLKVSGIPKVYEPGKVYKITVTLESPLKSDGEAQGGFAVMVSAGELMVTDERNTQLSNGYLTHTLEGSRYRKWTFAWKAPVSNTVVDMTIMAIAANGDYSPSNDAIATSVFTINPKR